MGLNILIIGECGVGKTHVMKSIIKELNLTEEGKVGTLNYLVGGNYILTGKYVGEVFDGSDKLSMSVMLSLKEFLSINTGKIIFYEGDRFMNKNFIKAAKPFIIKILGNGNEGRIKRGSDQSGRHLSSVSTRVSNITPALELKSSSVCFEVLNGCISLSNTAEGFLSELNKAKLEHKTNQQSLF